MSPNDIASACSLFGELRCGIHLRSLSGRSDGNDRHSVTVLESDSFAYDKLLQRIDALFDQTEWISAAQLADLWQLPLAIVQHHLNVSVALLTHIRTPLTSRAIFVEIFRPLSVVLSFAATIHPLVCGTFEISFFLIEVAI